MITTLIQLTTLCAFAVHVVVGCCAHHHHAPSPRAIIAESPPTPCACAHHWQRAPIANQNSAEATVPQQGSPHPDCHETKCEFVASTNNSQNAPSTCEMGSWDVLLGEVAFIKLPFLDFERLPSLFLPPGHLSAPQRCAVQQSWQA